MAKAARKKATTKKTARKKATKKSAPKKAARKAAAKKGSAKKGAAKKNKLGVKNSLVNNINARKKKGTSRSPRKSTVSKKSYRDMQNDWDTEK